MHFNLQSFAQAVEICTGVLLSSCIVILQYNVESNCVDFTSSVALVTTGRNYRSMPKPVIVSIINFRGSGWGRGVWYSLFIKNLAHYSSH